MWCVEGRVGIVMTGNTNARLREALQELGNSRFGAAKVAARDLGGSRSSCSSLACPAPLEPCTALCASLPSPPRLPLYACPGPARARGRVVESERGH